MKPKLWHYLAAVGLLVLLGVVIWYLLPQASTPSYPVFSQDASDFSPSSGNPPPVSSVGGRAGALANPSGGYAFSDLVVQLKAGEVVSITINGQSVTVKTVDQRTHRVNWPSGDIIETLRSFGVTESQLAAVKVDYVTPIPPWVWSLAIGLVMMLIIFLLLSRRSSGAGGGGPPFGQMGPTASRAKLVKPDQSKKVTFADVAGLEESKQELMEVVDFLKDPQRFMALGARIPKGVLLFGHPGCGKTLMARAVAGEAGVPFFSIAGSQFVEVFVGVGAGRVRDLFDQAKKNAPCIVFVDELDAVGSQRGPSFGGQQEHNQTLNELLTQMDGFDQNTNIVVIAATNRIEILDPALLRSGRFDRRVAVDPPDVRAREQIFGVHLHGKPLTGDVNVQILARLTSGFTGADIENTVNEAAILAVRRGRKDISMAEFKEAVEKVVAGPERKSRVISVVEKNVIAYHEAGHAIAMHFTLGSDLVGKISIVSRGMGLGYTWPLPEDDRNLLTREYILAQLVGLFGGRAAEELVFGEEKITTGASNDLQRATDYARRMVIEWGMSKVGLRSLSPLPGSSSWEERMRGEKSYSEDFARRVDEEITRILAEAYEKAKGILDEHREELKRVVDKLLEVETLEREEFLKLLS
ncbi:hypothetical protein A2V54_03145 [candidate division WWE3 bacterium RBG_19FT_COMBO_53_11]|uniref:ATP-dependent zinc metalloprotease FtsH n=1 Tax=candidate division WWE3 bacterium RBG_19FT_COMBO_53_11 TaxID=1802613 RepID=A0A1F4UHF6_UNCKA|nr:MAG: hypothetical protein A2155_02705 [candidate division WWE3 bacterium RBG_16_52_45]OGC44349.1 MAG: hypothetical protein A2V54_03145 [candidate division WWE3 bacterium RBG_19FT_COMBO_53_11]